MDIIKIQTSVKLTCRKDGKIKWQTEEPNLITNVGLAHFAKLISESDDLFRYLALGTSITEPLPTNTILGSEITTGGLERKLASLSRSSTFVANDTRVLTAVWTATANHNVGEVGVFSSASNGIMAGRRVEETQKEVLNSEELEAEYKIIFSGGEES